MIHKVVGTLITTSRGGELAGKDGGPTGSAKDTGGMGIGEIDSVPSKLIDIGSDCSGSFAEASDPIIHIVHCKEEDIGSLGSEGRLAK